jgi:putative CocE/NonD family hydrolase
MSERSDFDVSISQNVPVQMRDGVVLSTDIYVPTQDGQAAPGKFPALLVRTPYDNKPANRREEATYFAKKGYIFAVQDCRGRYRSQGRFFPFVDEPEDSFDTIEWLAKHPACDGQVGTLGASHHAWVQFHAATQAPPSLKTMIPMYGPTNAYQYSMREGGALQLWWIGWLRGLAGNGSHAAQKNPQLAALLGSEPFKDWTLRFSGSAYANQSAAASESLLDWYSRLPWQKGHSPLRHVPEYEEVMLKEINEENYTEFWRQTGLAMNERFESFPEIPILWIGGWYDYYPHSIADGFAEVAKLRKNQYLLSGPWDHSGLKSRCGDADFGSIAGIDLRELQLRWFDYWLKRSGELPLRANVLAFEMGAAADSQAKKTPDGLLARNGQWLEVSAWPPPQAKAQAFYLQSGGGLTNETPREQAASTTFTYDPNDPVPSIGWCYVSDERSGYALPAGPRDLVQPAPLLGKGYAGMPLSARRDVLVYTSAPLEKKLRVAGPIHVDLWISSDALDTDFTARLVDVYPPSPDYPAGYALPVAEGILRVRFRESFSDPKPLVPGKAERIRISLTPTANCFLPGHQLRVDISSSNFPRFEPNRNTWKPGASGFNRQVRAAENTVYHDSAHPSAITVLVLPD